METITEKYMGIKTILFSLIEKKKKIGVYRTNHEKNISRA